MSKSSKLYSDKGRVEYGHETVHKQLEGPKGPSNAQIHNLLRQTVLESIGKPDDLSHVDLKPLHRPGYYRINVYRNIKENIKMTDSYYVVFESTKVVFSNPILKKKYYDADLIKLFNQQE